MKRIIFLFALVLSLTNVHAATYVDDPNNCPVLFSSQNCIGGEVMCGFDSNILYCTDPSTLNAPSTNTTSNTDITSSFNGGYIIDCESYDGSAPLCDNSGNFWCDRDSTIYGTEFRETICVAGSFGVAVEGECRSGYYDCYGDTTCESTSTSVCQNSANNHYITATCNTDTSGGAAGACICETNYFACDGSITDTDGCEIQAGVSCGSGTGTISLETCFSSTQGFCSASGNNRDCNNDDGDASETSCNGADGCEITLFSDTNNTNSVYQTCSTFACSSGYLDCDGSGDGSNTANGCEINIGASCGSGTGVYAGTCGAGAGSCVSSGTTLDCNNDDSDGNEATCNGLDGCEVTIGAACTVGSLSGTYANSCSEGAGLCVIDKSYFETGTQTNYSSDDPLLWGVQYGGGDLANFTNANSNVSFAINNSGCLIFPDGTTQCSSIEGSINTSEYVPYENATQNVNLSSQNITTTGTGFFGFLGSLFSRITGLFVQDIDASGNIEVGGDVNISGNLQVTGNITGGSPVKVVGGLDVDGNTSLGGFVNVTGDLHMTNGSITHNSPVLIRDGLRLEDSSGTKYFDIEIEGISKHVETDAPDVLNGSLIFETWNTTNPYNIQIAFWDYTTHRPTLILDTVSEERASVFDGSLLVGKELGNATVDENYTHCEGFNLIDCNTTGTGADLGIEDDLETKGSIHAQGNLTVDGNTNFGEKITFSLGETLENIIDGIIQLTGTLNITGNLSVGEGIELNGTTITDFSQITGQHGLFESVNNTTQLKESEPIALSDDLVLSKEDTAIRNAENTTRAYISTEGIFTIEG